MKYRYDLGTRKGVTENSEAFRNQRRWFRNDAFREVDL